MRSRRERGLWEEELERRLSKPRGEGQDPPPRETHRQTPSELEHRIQASFMSQWIPLNVGRLPQLEAMFAIPNGGHRHPAVGGKMKAEGVKAGMPDLCLPVPVDEWAALYVEVKAPQYRTRKNGGLSKNQVERRDLLERLGNYVAVCYEVEEIIATVEAYLRGQL